VRGVAADRSRGRTPPRTAFERTLAEYCKRTTRALLSVIPNGGPPHLYNLLCDYPKRGGKGLRAALAIATCKALGGRERDALNSAVAIELFHNGFLIHDDLQDDSFVRRGAPTMHRRLGPAIAVNVGNATNLLALRCVMNNAQLLGSRASELIAEETERMMRHSLEGQAIELGWIHDNVCNLRPRDYLQMCLKKTSWYSFIYPMRVGAIVAEGAQLVERFCRLGWYVGAAFQIQDDILNLTGDYQQYRKEIGGDLREGKRTLMLIRLLAVCNLKERRALERYLATPRAGRTWSNLIWIRRLMDRYGTIEFARRAARQLAGAALIEALVTFRAVPNSEARQFIFDLVTYVVKRTR
jgi:geranylgeranyl diphosphate synthase type II